MGLAKALHLLPPEAAHKVTLSLLKAGRMTGMLPRPAADDPILAQELWGLNFANPVGLAAGFDKRGEVPDALLALGFGFTEVGTVTPRPQPGNPRPRVFRLDQDQAVINRFGFNSEGVAAMRNRLARRRRTGIVGVNLGKNKDSADAAPDYVAGLEALGPLADYVVINVSSPNTPGLRALQSRALVADLLSAVLQARAASLAETMPPVLMKIAPDLTAEERQDLAEVALQTGIDGMIVANTTVSRPAGLAHIDATQQGGLSGAPLREMSTALVADMYRLTAGQIPLIGAGGVASGADAYAKIRAGASLVQLYTALIYDGPGLVTRIKRDLAALLRRDGFADIAAAVGAGLPV